MLPFDTNSFPFKAGVFLVGGSVRDLLAGKVPYDYDLVVRQNPADFASGLATAIGGHVVELGKPGQKMLRVVTRERIFDIMPVSGPSIESDLRLRDFTINAMAVEVASGSLIDPLDGQKDLAAKTVRMVSPEVFRQDPVRLVRAYRMAAIFNFSIDRQTQSAIATDASLIHKSAAERIREELFKILQCAESHPYLTMMAHNNLLFNVFPEFLQLHQQQLRPAGSGTLLDRTLNSYNHLEILLNPEGEFRRTPVGQAFPDNDVERSVLIKWALLFHDLGRLEAKSSSVDGQSRRAEARADAGAVMARSICRRLRFSGRHSDIIEMIVRHHARPMILFSARATKKTLKKKFIRFFLDCRDVTPDVLLHALAAFRGQRQPDDPQLNEFTEFIHMLIQKYATVLRPRAALPPPLNGHDLIQEFGLQPSAEFKLILQRLEEQRLSQPDFTREEALQLVSKLVNQE